jgi:predicted ribosome quality control (RQC) complex YloA/Tae2 family protein
MGIPNSLHQHYAMITALSGELRQRLTGFNFKEAYTLSKEELVLVFENNNQWFTIKMVQQYQTCFLFFVTYQPDKISNAQPCFEEALGQTIVEIKQHPFNRSFEMVLANNTFLVFKLYDGLANVLLFDQGAVIDLFRKSITNDWELTPASFEGRQAAEDITPERFYVYKRMDIHPYYVTFTQQSDELIGSSKSAIEAYSIFSKTSLNAYRFFYLKQQLVNNTKHQIEKTTKHLHEIELAIKQQSVKVTDEEVANIIMANLHQIQLKADKVELFDFYRDQPIIVKLKKDLNAQQNAAYYYRKAKNKGIEIAKQNEQIEVLNKKLKEWEDKLVKMEAAQSYRELKGFVKEPTQAAKQSPFRNFTANGFDIWVGKSAANNDELTMRHSHKNDLWLHAKDVTGSHVLIKWKPGKPYTTEVIKVAAQLAAYYSKLKGSALVPVIYTPKKFVRKPKGAEPGSVVVDKEEVIMVSPKLPG